MIVWHGTNVQFAAFNLNWFGSGAGRWMGFGLYFAEKREGGEYFATYTEVATGKGYLYQVELNLMPTEVITLDSPVTHNPTKHPWSWDKYNQLRDAFGDREASERLVSQGIHAVIAYEQTKPGHGNTVLCLSPKRARVIATYRYSKNPYAWLPIGTGA